VAEPMTGVARLLATLSLTVSQAPGSVAVAVTV
jgi:hypothetical protein